MDYPKHNLSVSQSSALGLPHRSPRRSFSQTGGMVAVSCGQYAVEGLLGDAEFTHSSL